MSNSAIIKARGQNIGVYLHWNGGTDSVKGFLEYCKLKGYAPFQTGAGLARFVQVVGNFFGGSGSLDIVTCPPYESDEVADGLDNGIYVVEGWNIVARYGKIPGSEGYEDVLKGIDEKQPQAEQLGEFLEAETVSRENVKIGDIVFMKELNGTYKKYPVVGFGQDEYRNGQNVKGAPYAARYGNAERGYDWNVNNYILTDTVRVAKK